MGNLMKIYKWILLITFCLATCSNFAFCQGGEKTEIIEDIGVTFKVTMPPEWKRVDPERGRFEKENPETVLWVKLNKLPSRYQKNKMLRDMNFNGLKNILREERSNSDSQLQLMSEEEGNFLDSDRSYLTTRKYKYTILDTTKTKLMRDLLFMKGSLIYKIDFSVVTDDIRLFDKEWSEVETIIKTIEIVNESWW